MKKVLEFTKMHGAGNDYIYVDTERFPVACPERASLVLSNRHKGIGSDGLILIGRSDAADFSMRIFNADGSEAMMCGNGARCVGKYVYDKGLTRKTDFTLATLSGLKRLHISPGADGRAAAVTVGMGAPRTADTSQCAAPEGRIVEGAVEAGGRQFTGTFVSMGNPHFVIFCDDAATRDITADGPLLERATAFPERCNIEFATLRADGSLRVRVWERGSGVTMACGTGACAVAVAAFLTGRSGRTVDIAMDGGDLHAEWDEATDEVFLSGPAEIVFEGRVEIDD